MSVSSDLQAVVSRVSAAVAGGKTYGKVELGALLRELRLIRDEARAQEEAAAELIAHANELSDQVISLGRGFVRPQLEAEPAQ